jgi:protein ImuB
MFGALYAAAGSDSARLEDVAREFSPRIDVCGPRDITLDLSGLSRLFGDARAIASELRRTAADRGLQVRVAIAGSRTAARLLVRHRAGATIVEPGDDAESLAPLPLELLLQVRGCGPSGPPKEIDDTDADICASFRRWGLRTLGEVAALPPADVAARLGQAGVQWQRLARGEDATPLVPSVPEERFEQALDLEWPIDGLEPLSFVLGRLMEPLAAHLERRDRGAAVLHVRLHLVSKAVHERSLELPAPMRDARTLRTLVLLDLESHPPAAAIDRVVVAVDPTPARVLQYSLLTRPLPSPEQVSTLMARLGALMGEGRCGAPSSVDSWRPGSFAMAPFAPSPDGGRVGGVGGEGGEGKALVVALKRFRFAVPARVQVEGGQPVRITTERRGISGGRVEKAAGPWRTSGEWWLSDGTGRTGEEPWDRDEWDVTVSDGATYRIFRERDSNAWFLDGVLD